MIESADFMFHRHLKKENNYAYSIKVFDLIKIPTYSFINNYETENFLIYLILIKYWNILRFN